MVKKVEEQGLLYKDYKVVPWCPRCGTALSSHELAQGYEDVKDISIYVKFKLKNQESVTNDTYLLGLLLLGLCLGECCSCSWVQILIM